MAAIITTPTPASLKNAVKHGGTVSSSIFSLATDSGTPAAVPLTVGFNPRFVEVWNVTAPAIHKWNSSMSDASQVSIDSTGTITYAAANGVTVSSGVVTLGTGIIAASSTYYITMLP